VGAQGTSRAPLRQTHQGRVAGARVPPMHYLDKPPQRRVSRQPNSKLRIQVLIVGRVQFRTSLNTTAERSFLHADPMSLLRAD
jgi:hypothetical protein